MHTSLDIEIAGEEATTAELSCRVAVCALLYFERQHGRARMEEVYARIPDAPPLSYVRDLNNWISFDFGTRMLDSLAEASGDPDFPVHAGRFGMTPESLGFAYYMLRALANPRTAYQRVVAVLKNVNRAGLFTIDRLTDRQLVLRYHSRRPEPSLTGCRMRQGQFAEMPTLWGLPRARIAHPQCQVLGAEACVYELTWTSYTSRLWWILGGALAGGCAGLLPWTASALSAHPLPAWLAVGSSLGLAWAYLSRSRQALKLLADQDEGLALSTRDLAHRFDDIRQLNQTLEEKVEARTQELSRASDQLKSALQRQAELLDSEMRARLEAERANRAKDQFLATLSHELRTPLTTVLTHADLLSRLASPDPRVERGAAAIRRSAVAQTRLVDDLLDISRIVSGKLIFRHAPVELAAAAAEAVAIARPLAEARSLRLEATISPSLGTVLGDAVRLQQIVGNVLANAIKFTPQGGRIQVRAERVDGHAEIEVSDNGMGIRPEFLPHVFNRFVQADSSVTRTYGGLGLGLALVRYLTEAHGGQVHAESAGEGQGATFRITLPLATAEAHPVPVAPLLAQAGHDMSGLRVLLVDDDDDSRDAFTLSLGQCGARVRAVSSAAAGLAAIGEFQPQVILCDVAMPVEDGFSFIRRVRRLPPEQGGQVPAAAVTAFTGAEDRERALAAGFQVHLPKPVDAAQLVQVVRTLAAWSGEHPAPGTQVAEAER